MSKNESQAKPTGWLASGKRLPKKFLIGYGLLVLMIALIQRMLMYHPTRADDLPPPSPEYARTTVFPVETVTSDGITLNGWHWTADGHDGSRVDDGRLVVLFFHGNGGHRGHRVPNYRLMAELGLDILSFDYRGYAENAGKPSETGLHRDAEAVWKLAVEQLNIAPNRILIYGASLGGGVAVRLASDVCSQGMAPAGVILRSTFSSMTDAASFHYPWLPVRLVLLDRYPSEDRIGQVTAPILMLHGTSDRVVPVEMGQQLFEAAPKESSNGIAPRFVPLNGAGHNDVLMLAGATVHSEIRNFVETLRDLSGNE